MENNSEEFVINEYLSLKLEGGKTYIYFKGKKYLQCMRLVLNILKDDIPKYDEINSIDEAAEVYKNHLFQNRSISDPTVDPVKDLWLRITF